MGKGRVDAFSDGVFAIIITIMVLELKVPHEADLASLLLLWPVFASHVLSFVNLGIYWNNHHHMFHIDVRTTMIYTHVLNRGRRGVRSLADAL